jgi:LAO/AO transport system kinase
VQVAKAGILEVADVFVVNKADRDGAEVVARDLRQMLHLGQARPWRVPVVLTVAERGDGVGELVEAVAAHRDHLASSGELERRRRLRAAREVEEIALADLRDELGELRRQARPLQRRRPAPGRGQGGQGLTFSCIRREWHRFPT